MMLNIGITLRRREVWRRCFSDKPDFGILIIDSTTMVNIMSKVVTILITCFRKYKYLSEINFALKNQFFTRFMSATAVKSSII